MSTRSTLAHVVQDRTFLHLYHEMHDESVHLDIGLENTYVVLNLVIPTCLVDGVTKILQRAGEDH
jgi:hypothetical protein